MKEPLIYCAGSTAASQYASEILGEQGFQIVHEPRSDVQYVLLDVPSLGQRDQLRSGKSLQALLKSIPGDAVLLGGNLDHPLLAPYRKIDILKNESYLKENARITAYCALQIISEALAVTMDEAHILVIGWGRIGKALTSLLIKLGASVSVASHDPEKIAALKHLGIHAVDTASIAPEKYTLIVNTAPAPVVNAETLLRSPATVKIDLASSKGLGGPDVIWARGLPGIHAPKSSGSLIARSIIPYIREDIS